MLHMTILVPVTMRLDSGSNKSQKQISSQLSEPPSGGFLLSTTPLKQELAVLVSANMSIGKGL